MEDFDGVEMLQEVAEEELSSIHRVCQDELVPGIYFYCTWANQRSCDSDWGDPTWRVKYAISVPSGFIYNQLLGT